jgi:hypothetical protein
VLFVVFSRNGYLHFKWTKVSPMIVILGTGLVEALIN